MTEAKTATEESSEAGALAGELANSFGKLVQVYEKHFALSREVAVQRAAEAPLEYSQRVLNGPPEEVS